MWLNAALAVMDRVSDRATAEELYRKHRDRVYHLCLRLSGGNIAWAEDATHDVFVRLLERESDLSDLDDLGGWVYRVTMNTCMTRLRREGSVWGRVLHTLSGSSAAASHETPERLVSARQEVSAALEVLRGLPDRERVVFCMRHLDELPQKEIAATLSLSEGYVSKLLDRTRERMRRLGFEVADA